MTKFTEVHTHIYVYEYNLTNLYAIHTGPRHKYWQQRITIVLG
jgi:hypothetical protein